MQHLSPDSSWQLFLKIAFTNEYKCPNHLKKIGRKIVKKCMNLPLAIKEAGRQLATKTQSESAWEEFLESMDFSETITVLELSYHKLSQELKSCFVHMSFFTEGETIKVQKWVNIWSAMGMVIRVVEGKKNEDNARSYLQKLLQESMIMKVENNINTDLKSICIDGFLHKICITKAQEEIGFEILRNEEHYRPPWRPRHRAIYCSREKFNYSTNQDSHILSLFFHGGDNFEATSSYWESFELLMILDLEGFGLKTLPETVCTLSRLRYLGLRDNYLQELPRTVGQLKNLEVLDITLNFMIEVPDIIWEMDSLRHLYMSDIICRTPLQVDLLKYLQTLTYISVENWTYELSNLEKMTSLCKLGIEEVDGNSDMSKLFASLAKLKNLKCLILRGSRFKSMLSLNKLDGLDGLTQLKLDGRLTRLPKFPQNITCLTLVNSCLDVDPMAELEKLPRLFCLKLRNAYSGQEMAFSHNDKLSKMCIGELWHLRKHSNGVSQI